jgi:hypothetical protein
MTNDQFPNDQLMPESSKRVAKVCPMFRPGPRLVSAMLLDTLVIVSLVGH